MTVKNDSFDEEGALGKAYDARLIRRLLGYVAPHRRKMASAVALIVLSSLLQLGGPLITAVALDLFVRPLDQEVEISRAALLGRQLLESGGWELTPLDGVAWAAIAYLALLAVTLVVLFGQASVMQVMGQLIMSDLRSEIFSHLQRLDVPYFDSQPVGRLVTRVTTDVDALNELFTAGFVSIFGDVVLLAGIVGVLFWMDWRLALVTFSVLPLLLALTFWFKTRARRAFREVRVKIARINAFLQEHLSGMTVVQLFGGEEDAYRRFQGVNRDHRDANVRAILYYAVYFPAVELFTALGVALILWYGGGQVIQGAVSMGALVAFLQYSQRFYQPLADLSEKYNILQAAMASSERIFQLLDTEAEISTPPGAYCPEEMAGELELRGVFFAYRPGTWVLEDLSFRVAPGERVALVGHTGAGKSTVASLLLRFYDVNRGSILVDGVDVSRWDLPELRRRVALVLQDVFLFSGDVASNVALGREGVSRERTLWALRELGCQALIDRVDEPLKERGAGLSVGEKQLLAFARALAADPRVLVLDEATSSVDPESEAVVQRALKRLLQGRTSVIIAHRLSTVRTADRILVLHRGRLREQGRHDELLAQGGIYEKLCRIQFGEQLSGEATATPGPAVPAPRAPEEAPPPGPSSPRLQGSDREP